MDHELQRRVMRTDSKPSFGPADDRARWVQWRMRRLRSAGFSPDLADRLARRGDVDLHGLLELVDRGCPPELAARILAPLSDPLGAA
jgi:hypothetical protein